jgi:hypothetical protein
MRWVGKGSELWRVRVDLFAEDDDGRRVSAAAEGLRSLLTEGERDPDHVGLGADQGLGVANRPVVGLLFWVRADDVGAAAVTAVETAQHAGVGYGVGPELYDVTVIPSRAVVRPDDPSYPSMPD